MSRGGYNWSRGEKGESLAAEFLVQKGMKILARNYRFERGEVDLVCEDGDELVFVEVKTRTTSAFGDPEEAVTESKQEQIRKVADGYCMEFHLDERFYRFDIVAVVIRGKTSVLRHIPDAF